LLVGGSAACRTFEGNPCGAEKVSVGYERHDNSLDTVLVKRGITDAAIGRLSILKARFGRLQCSKMQQGDWSCGRSFNPLQGRRGKFRYCRAAAWQASQNLHHHKKEVPRQKFTRLFNNPVIITTTTSTL
jgi:hypothetical protein